MDYKSLRKIEADLQAQVQKEYNDGSQHTSQWRADVQGEVRNIKRTPPQGDVYIDLVRDNLDLERSLFLSDESDVTFVSEDGVIASRTMKSLKDAWRFDEIDTLREDIREQIIIDNCYYGIAVEVSDIYDEDENQPMSVLINPDVCIPDPKCTNSSGMRFFGFSRKVPLWRLKSDDYNIKGLEITETDQELLRSNQARQDGNYLQITEGYGDIYEHYTIYHGKKCLTTWANNRGRLIRYIELGELTKAEQLNPMKCNFNVVFHRRKPYPYRWAGYRMMEDVGNEQDIITQLTNLSIEQARISAYGPDTIVDASLGIDSGKLQKLKKGGRIIPVAPISQGGNIANHIYQKQYAGNNNLANEINQQLDARVKRKTGYTDITMGVSPNGSQTKGEIQQLQANAQKSVLWVRSNYLKGEKEYAKIWVRMYQENMSDTAKKIIALFDKGGNSRTLKKADFIPDGKILIDIKSASDERSKNEQSSVKLQALLPNIIPNLKSEYAVNSLLRTLIDKSGIGVEGETIIPKNSDELLAMSRVDMINNNIPIMSKPQPGEDLQTHIDIYEKCLDTESRDNILTLYKESQVKQKAIMPQVQGGQIDQGSANTAQSMLASQMASAPQQM